jgi:prevent-host-death family protein
MINIKQDTTLVGVSELRTRFDEVMAVLGSSKVVLEKRHKPIAVIVPIEKFNQMEALIELIEDSYLASYAQDRDRSSNPADFIDIKELEKRLSRK